MTAISPLQHVRALRAGAIASAVLSACCSLAWAQVTPSDSLAAQLRIQGHRCDEPISAQQDAQQSRPDEARVDHQMVQCVLSGPPHAGQSCAGRAASLSAVRGLRIGFGGQPTTRSAEALGDARTTVWQHDQRRYGRPQKLAKRQYSRSMLSRKPNVNNGRLYSLLDVTAGC
jgi:hypothetical protein